MAFPGHVAFLVLLAFCAVWAENKCITQRLDSNSYKYVQTLIPGASYITSVNVVVRHSRTSCTSSYGFKGPILYADKGCRATFNVCYETGTTRQIQCDSYNFQPNTCDAGVPIERITVLTQYSNTPCVEGDTYSKLGSQINVFRGCRALFIISP